LINFVTKKKEQKT